MENKDGKHWRDICVQLLKMKETEVETKQSESDKVENCNLQDPSFIVKCLVFQSKYICFY